LQKTTSKTTRKREKKKRKNIGGVKRDQCSRGGPGPKDISSVLRKWKTENPEPKRKGKGGERGGETNLLKKIEFRTGEFNPGTRE